MPVNQIISSFFLDGAPGKKQEIPALSRRNNPQHIQYIYLFTIVTVNEIGYG